MKERTVLLIDDDAELCAELAEMLEAEGYAPTCEQDSLKGETLIAEGSFDAVILDFKMPLATGAEILGRMKAAGIRAPVLLVSGRPFVEKELREKGLADMVCAVLGKPIDPDLLLQKLAAAVKSR